MQDEFSSVRSLLIIKPICIDNWVFLLHHKLTVILLLVCSAIVTSYQYVGNPIVCLSDNKEIMNIMNRYCWITTTFTVPERVGRVGEDMVCLGVGHREHSDSAPDKYHNYYQWVYFTLLFQAVLFYVPRYIWKLWEGGRMRCLVEDLDHPVINNKCREESVSLIVKYFQTYIHEHNSYAESFFFCEVLNLVNVLGQMYFMDVFLNGEFRTYGWEFITSLSGSDASYCHDVMDRVFPKQTKCTFNTYGPSGSIQNEDAICVLSANNVNEIIYVCLWFWFGILAVVTFLQLIYSITVAFSPRLRAAMLCCGVTRAEINAINDRFRIGDWFVMYQVSKNVDWQIFKQLVTELTVALDSEANDDHKMGRASNSIEIS